MLTALDGLKVLDFGQFFAGPFTSRLLADLGANVVKLEPYQGDTMRPLARPFASGQRGKRGIAVDMKAPAGLEIARKLAAWADVVTHNMRPGAAERIGIGYEQVRAINPSVIYVHAPGWGTTGPDASRQSFAPLVSGLAGLHFECAGEGNPPVAPVNNEDYANPFVSAPAILMALLHRQKTGEGQFIESPQLNATLTLAMHIMRRPDGTVIGRKGLDSEQLGTHPLNRLYRTADGWICIVVRTDEQFLRLCRAFALNGAAVDERFATAAARTEHAAALAAVLEPAFAGRPTAECAGILGNSRVPCEVPRPYTDAFFEDPAQVAAGRVDEYDHPAWGRIKEIGRLVRISDTAPTPGRPSPTLGQHTQEILEQLGYGQESIRALYEQKVVR